MLRMEAVGSIAGSWTSTCHLVTQRPPALMLATSGLIRISRKLLEDNDDNVQLT